MEKFKGHVNSIVTLLFFSIFASVGPGVVPALADMGVYCPKCKRHLYDFKGEVVIGQTIKASDFVSVEGVEQPVSGSRMVCPFDSAPLNGWEYWFYEKGREEPRFAFNAVTLLTKDENGEFRWFPDDVVMDEDVKKP